MGHSTAVIDRAEEAFRRLGDDFAGQRVLGVGFDRDTLIEAGIEQAEAFAAVSNGDNSNIIAARVARETFDVRRVVARIYDPGRAEVYERLGIPTVATVRWTADQITRRLLATESPAEWSDPSGLVTLSQIATGSGWIGRRLRELEEVADVRVGCVTRLGEGRLPDRQTVVQEGDVLHVMLAASRRDAVGAIFASDPEQDA